MRKVKTQQENKKQHNQCIHLTFRRRCWPLARDGGSCTPRASSIYMYLYIVVCIYMYILPLQVLASGSKYVYTRIRHFLFTIAGAGLSVAPVAVTRFARAGNIRTYKLLFLFIFCGCWLLASPRDRNIFTDFAIFFPSQIPASRSRRWQLHASCEIYRNICTHT